MKFFFIFFLSMNFSFIAYSQENASKAKIRSETLSNQQEELTLAMIKPDAVERHLIGKIIAHYEQNGLYVAAMKTKLLSKKEAEGFYIEHKGKPFFEKLVTFMTSKPVVLLVLKGKNAIAHNRTLMGKTDPSLADEGTIRKLYAKNKSENSVHGSDSVVSAKREITYFFAETDIN